MPYSIEQYRKSQERSPKKTPEQDIHPSRFPSNIPNPENLLLFFMMLGTVNATTAGESKEAEIPYAVDPNEMPKRPIRIAKEIALRLLPEMLSLSSPKAEYPNMIAKAGPDLAMISRFNS